MRFKKLVSGVLSIVLVTSSLVASVGMTNKVASAATSVRVLDGTALNIAAVDGNGKKAVFYNTSTKALKSYDYDANSFVDVKVLTNTLGKASISSNGSTIAWTERSTATTRSQVLAVSSSGGTPVEVSLAANNVPQYLIPAISPDGDKIAYHDTTASKLYVYSISKGTRTEVPLFNGYTKMVAATKSDLSYAKFSENGDLYFSMNQTGSTTVGGIFKWDGTTTTSVLTDLATMGTSDSIQVLAVSDTYLMWSRGYASAYVRDMIEGTTLSTPNNISITGTPRIIADRYLQYTDSSNSLYVDLAGVNADVSLSAGYMSNDGSKLYALHVDTLASNKREWRIIDVNMQGAPIGLPTQPLYNGSTVSTFNGALQINWTTPSVYEKYTVSVNDNIVYDGAFVNTTGATISNSISSNITTFSIPNYSYGKSLDVRVTATNSAGISDPLQFNITTASNPAKLGSSNASLGDVVSIANKQFTLIGDNLLADITTSDSRAFDPTAASKVFDPLVAGSLADYLNNSYYAALPADVKSVLVSHKYDLSYADSTGPSYSAEVKVGIPTKALMAGYPKQLLSGVNTTLMWIMDPTKNNYNYGQSTTLGVGTFKYDNKTVANTYITNTSRYIPVVALDPNAAIVKSTGPVTDKYTVNGITAPVVLTAPADFKLVGKTKDSYHVSWEKVDGATSYVLKDNGVQVYSGPLNSYQSTGLSPDSEHALEVHAVESSNNGPTSSLLVQTDKDSIAYPLGLTVTSVTYDSVSYNWQKVEGAEEYILFHDGVQIGSTTSLSSTDTGLSGGTKLVIGVKARKGMLLSEASIKEVYIPKKPVEGTPPAQVTDLKVVKAYSDKVKLQWSTVTNAVYYDLLRDDNMLVYRGPLTTISDETTGPEQGYNYKVVAGNEFGNTVSDSVFLMTPPEAPSIVITPTEATYGTITFKFAMIEGDVSYQVARNPEWDYTPNGDGSFHVTKFNTATGVKEDLGNISPTPDGKLPFVEQGVDPGKDYHYDIIATRLSSNGVPVVVGESKVDITTPVDGSGATIPSDNPTTPTTPTDPGTTPTDPTGNNSGSGGSKGGNSNGGGGSTSPSVGETNPSTPSSDGTTTSPEGNNGVVTPPTTSGGTNTNIPAKNFGDVSNSSFAAPAIEKLAQDGVLKGYADGTFQPNGKVTRVEFAVILARAFIYKSNGAYNYKFKDINPNAWYGEELTAALQNGVTKGFSATSYKPGMNIPREQAAIMISNILRKTIEDGNMMKGQTFTDMNSVVSWARQDVLLAAGEGIITGYSDGTFGPKKDITRAEVAVMVYRLLYESN